MIKNIIFDIDGVLVDSNLTYTEFLKHTYDKYKDIEYDDLPYLFPMSLDDGAIKLTADLPADLSNVKQVNSMTELAEFLNNR